MKFYNTRSIVLSLATGLFLLGCGGGGSSDSAGSFISSSTAFLSDSRLQGVTYTCGSETGLTTAEGAFSYTDGVCTAVEFSIGGISLGSINVADISPDKIIYPADLLGLDRNNTTEQELTNMLQLLQSLDSDGNPYNGITIDANTSSTLQGSTLSFDNNATLADINSTLTSIGANLVPRDDAVAHYEDTLRNDLNISVDTVPPSAAIITNAPSETYTNTTSITINGEVGAQIWVNGLYIGLNIDSNNSAVFDVNTSDNSDTNNSSSIVLRDDNNASSNATESSIFRASQATLDIREIAAIKSELISATNPRTFTYTQMWNSGDDYNISFTSIPAATTETQEYNATVTITKGLASDTLSIPETVLFSQDLRDTVEVAALKANLTARNFSYTQQWATGDDYNVTFSEDMRAVTTETQTYDVITTIKKGNAQETVIFTETIPYNQDLRDTAEVAAIKATLTGRNFSYAQQWTTGSTYNISFSETLRSASTENQSYNVTAIISKGNASDNTLFIETVPFSQILRDIAEVDAALNAFQSSNDPRNHFYTNNWSTTGAYSISFSEPKRTATAIDQTYAVIITITIGTYSNTIVFNEYIPTTNVNIVLGDGTTTLINDEYSDAFTVTNGGIFQKIGEESSFIGAAISVETAGLNISSSGDLLNYITSRSGLSGLSSISLNNSSDGSLVARYEVATQETNLYEILESLLASINYVIEGVDFTLYSDINNTVIDFYVEYDSVNASYIIVSLSDKTIDVDSDITKVINKDSIVEVGETIVNEEESFTITDISNRGDFLFVMDDSGSMSEEQSASVEAIGRTFSTAVARYNLDWKATVIGTSYNNTYSTLTGNPSENNITKLTTQLSLGTSGSGTETGLKRAYIALDGGAVVERNNSSLSVIYISDEIEHSSLSDFGESNTDFSNSYFAVNGIKYNVIIPTSYTADNDYATRMYLETEGSRANLTNYASGYDQMMDNIVRYAVAKSSSVKLTYPALASSITVHVNGVKTTFWEYDPAESAIVFDAVNMPNINDQVIVTYSHLDFSSMVSSAKTEFDALSDDAKRAYRNDNVTLSFNPESPVTPLANSDQTYDVTVTFNAFGYTETSTFQETVLSANYSITSSQDWLQTGNSFESQNHTDNSTSTLELTIVVDSNISYSVSSESCCDKLRITVNSTLIGDFTGTGSVNVLTNDAVLLEYHKDSSVSDGTDNAIITIQ